MAQDTSLLGQPGGLVLSRGEGSALSIQEHFVLVHSRFWFLLVILEGELLRQLGITAVNAGWGKCRFLAVCVGKKVQLITNNTSDSQSFSLHGTHELITEILWHANKIYCVFLPI